MNCTEEEGKPPFHRVKSRPLPKSTRYQHKWLHVSLQVTQLNMEDFEPDSWAATITAATFVVVMSSTYGPGSPPGTASKFIAWAQNNNGEAKDAFEGAW